MPTLLIALFIGLEILNIPDDVLPEWLNLFKEYPILNQGTFEGVKNNFKKFSKEPHCAFLLAKINDRLIGIATGIPLSSYSYEAELFEKNNLDPAHYYLMNDLIVLPQCRNQGIGSKLYGKLEKLAQAWGYTNICFCTVERDESHPLKPATYKNTEAFYRRLGFKKPNITIKEAWPTIINEQGDVEMQENSLIFWIKDLKSGN